MIYIPENTEINHSFRVMINFFNHLEQDLEYPKCEGYADQRRVLEQTDVQFKVLLEDLV